MNTLHKYMLTAIGAAVGFAGTAQALVVEFDAAQNYSNGQLLAQTIAGTGTGNWTQAGSGSVPQNWQVDATTGVMNFSNTAAGGSRMVAGLNTANLGFDPAAPGNIVEYSFDFTFISNVYNATGLTGSERTRITLNGPGIEFAFFPAGNTSIEELNAGGGVSVANFGTLAAGNTASMKLVLDYVTDTYVTFLNGNEVGSSRAFSGVAPSRFSLSGDQGTGIVGDTLGGYKYKIDNMSLSMIPEPSSIVLLGIGLLVFGCISRRRKA